MHWPDERYVRIYTRDTSTTIGVAWQGRLVLWELLRKVDRAGVLDHGGDLAVVADLLRVPLEIFEVGLERLRDRGSVVVTEHSIVVPNFREAQEAIQTDAQRQRESRARRREVAMADGADPATAKAIARPDYYPVTNRDDMRSQDVTIGHARSHVVTPGHSDPCLAVPNQKELICAAEAAPQLALVHEGTGSNRTGLSWSDVRRVTEGVIGKLNREAGAKYQPTAESTLKKVRGLMMRGYTEEDMRLVVWHRATKWRGDPKMDDYLRPKTLFSLENFENYLAAARQAFEGLPDDEPRNGVG